MGVLGRGGRLFPAVVTVLGVGACVCFALPQLARHSAISLVEDPDPGQVIEVSLAPQSQEWRQTHVRIEWQGPSNGVKQSLLAIEQTSPSENGVAPRRLRVWIDDQGRLRSPVARGLAPTDLKPRSVHSLSLELSGSTAYLSVDDAYVGRFSVFADPSQLFSNKFGPFGPDTTSTISVSQKSSSLSRDSETLLLSLAAISLMALVILITLRWNRRIPSAFNRADTKQLIRSVSATTAGVSAAVYAGSLTGVLPYQFVTPDDRYRDSLNILEMGLNDPYAHVASNYPPVAHLLLGSLGVFGEASIAMIFLIGYGLIVATLLRVCRTSTALTGWLPGLALSLSYPVIFALDRANMDLVAMALTCLGLSGFVMKRRIFTGLFVGLAGAIKVLPLLVFAPLLLRKGWRREGIIAVALALSLSFAILIVFGWQENSTAEVLTGVGESGFLPLESRQAWSTSLIPAVTTVFDYVVPGVIRGQVLDEGLSHPVARGALVALVILIVLASGIFVREIWKAILISTSAVILLAPVAFSYRAVFLLLPLVAITSARAIIPRVRVLGILYGLALAPLGLFVLDPEGRVLTDSLLRPLTILALLCVALFPQNSLRWEFPPWLKPRNWRTTATPRIAMTLGPLGAVILSIGLLGSRPANQYEWEWSAGNLKVPTQSLIAGRGGAEGEFLFEDTPGDGAFYVRFPAVGGPVSCPETLLIISGDRIDVSRPQLQALTSIRPDQSQNRSLLLVMLSGDGRGLKIARGRWEQTVRFASPVCVNMASLSIEPPSSPGTVSLTWKDQGIDARPWVLAGAFILVLAVSGIFVTRRNGRHP